MSLDYRIRRLRDSALFQGDRVPRGYFEGMGWYRYIPGMECYHGVVSMDHALRGELLFDGERIDLSGGRGYIEKDWGTSFPSSWIWMQSNSFGTPGVSLMLSIAKIPWFGRHFTGFLSFLRTPDGLVRCATYTGASIERLEVDEQGVAVVLSHRATRLHIRAHKGAPGGLKAPVAGAMERTIAESTGPS